MAGVAVAGGRGGVLGRAHRDGWYHPGDAQVVVETYLSEWERARPVEPTGRGGGGRLYRFEPIDRLVGVDPDGAPLPAAVVAARLRVHGRQVLRWRSYGALTERQADELATRLGVHPSMVWPDW